MFNEGDQVVSVNGESVICKSYAQVVQMIQKSGPNLQLMVMPKEHDVLQQVRIFAIISIRLEQWLTKLGAFSCLEVHSTLLFIYLFVYLFICFFLSIPHSPLVKMMGKKICLTSLAVHCCNSFHTTSWWIKWMKYPHLKFKTLPALKSNKIRFPQLQLVGLSELKLTGMLVFLCCCSVLPERLIIRKRMRDRS